jgi:hypothetical protein
LTRAYDNRGHCPGQKFVWHITALFSMPRQKPKLLGEGFTVMVTLWHGERMDLGLLYTILQKTNSAFHLADGIGKIISRLLTRPV